VFPGCGSTANTVEAIRHALPQPQHPPAFSPTLLVASADLLGHRISEPLSPLIRVVVGLAVVPLDRVTAWMTRAARLALLEVDRHQPIAKLDPFADMQGLRACVKVVAGPTRSPPLFFVDVEKMKISISIAKICEGARTLDGYGQIFVARKAESVLIEIESRVKPRRERLFEQAEIRTSVGLVAPRAAVLADRLVPLRVLIQQALHIHQLRVARLDWLVVAAQAELLLRLQEVRSNVRRVWRMTVEAAGFVECRSVVYRSVLRFIHDVVVTLVTEFLSFSSQHVLAWATVWVMTLSAAIFHRAVNRFCRSDEIGDLIVTIPAEFYPLRE
jgi:hypothetical protein